MWPPKCVVKMTTAMTTTIPSRHEAERFEVVFLPVECFGDHVAHGDEHEDTGGQCKGDPCPIALTPLRKTNDTTAAMGEMKQNVTRYLIACFFLLDKRNVDDSENTTTSLWIHMATSTMTPTSVPATNALASARPSKHACMDSPMNAESDVMSCA